MANAGIAIAKFVGFAIRYIRTSRSSELPVLLLEDSAAPPPATPPPGP